MNIQRNIPSKSIAQRKARMTQLLEDEGVESGRCALFVAADG